MTIGFLVYVAIGKLLVFIGQKFLLDNLFQTPQFLKRLFSCDLCLGVWVYTLLSGILRVFLFTDVYGYVPLLSELITGCSISFLVHLLSLGWKSKFEVVIV